MEKEKKLLENIKDLLYYYQLQPEKKFIIVSPSITRMIGVTEQEVYKEPKKFLNRIHPEDQWLFQKRISGEVGFELPLTIRIKNHLGEYIWLEDYSSGEYDENGDILAITGSLRDITMRKKSQEEMRYKINHDAITGVYNRYHFETKFKELNEITNTSVGIIMCDIDDLKLINDKEGHFVGDSFIVAAGEVLLQISSDKLMVFRIGGDEFCILVTETSREEVINMKKYVEKLLEIHNECNTDLAVRMSMGHAYGETSLGKMQQLFKKADKAMYADKRSKKFMIP